MIRRETKNQRLKKLPKLCEKCIEKAMTGRFFFPRYCQCKSHKQFCFNCAFKLISLRKDDCYRCYKCKRLYCKSICFSE